MECNRPILHQKNPAGVAFLPMLDWRGLVQPLHFLIIIDSQWCLSYNFFNKSVFLLKSQGVSYERSV